jgi:hypothetical protein
VQGIVGGGEFHCANGMARLEPLPLLPMKSMRRDLRFLKGWHGSKMSSGTSKKGLKLSLGLPRGNYLTSTALTQLKLFMITIKHLKKDSIPPTKGNEGEVDLTHEETEGDFTSQSSTSSSIEDDDAISKGLRSNNSIKGEEDMSVTGSG